MLGRVALTQCVFSRRVKTPPAPRQASESPSSVLRPALATQAWTIQHRHHRGQHRRDDSLLAMLDRNYIRGARGQRTTRPDHAGSGDEALSLRRRQQIDLEFHREDRGFGRHQRQGGIPARAIGDRGNDPGVDEPMLLGEVRAERKLDSHTSGPDRSQVRAQHLHHSLTCEARPQTSFEIGGLCLERHHVC